MASDPLTLAVVANALVAISEEMGSVIRRTSFSEAVREGEDCSASVFDAEGNAIAQGNYAPGHLGASEPAVKAVLRRYPPEDMRPGDAFLLNDPPHNSGHLPDFFSVAPIFSDDELVGLTVVTAHHVDVGGASPGSQAVARIVDMHQEGIRILPCRYFAGGEPVQEILELIAANVRMPTIVLGDLKGQYNANMVGAMRVRELVDRFGLDTFRECAAEIVERSERAMRAAITEVPDGRFGYVDYMDDSGPGTDPVRVEVHVTVRGDTLEVDFGGSSDATRSGVNSYLTYTRAYAYHAVKCVIAPQLPQNTGCMRPVVVVAPEGSFFNPRYPTASGGRAITSAHISDAVIGALAQVVPDRVQAASSQFCNASIGGVHDDGTPFVYYDLTFGSTGARPFKDACDGLVSGFNCSNVPVEIQETTCPIRVERFGYVADSGGAGTYRGGLAVRRDVRSLTALSRLSNLHDRHHTPARGLFGGRDGAAGQIVRNLGSGGEEELHSKSTTDLLRGDVMTFQTCGGGGWGDPLDREPEAVLADVREGWVTVAGAERDYGVVVEQHEHELVLLGDETAAVREARRGADAAGAAAHAVKSFEEVP
jgi:N-methylhydantoinase B